MGTMDTAALPEEEDKFLNIKQEKIIINIYWGCTLGWTRLLFQVQGHLRSKRRALRLSFFHKMLRGGWSLSFFNFSIVIVVVQVVVVKVVPAPFTIFFGSFIFLLI